MLKDDFDGQDCNKVLSSPPKLLVAQQKRKTDKKFNIGSIIKLLGY